MTPAPATLEALRALPAGEAERLGIAHTLPEILQQPSLWLETARLVRERHLDVARFFERAGLFEAAPPQIVLIGAGSSDYVAQLVAPAWRARFGVATQALPSTDLLTQVPALLCAPQRYLFVWFSRSGNTPEALELLPLLESAFADSAHLFITCNAQGELARRGASLAHAATFLLPDAANDRGLAMTSSFTCMALAGLLLARGESESESVVELARAAERLLQRGSARMETLIERGHRSACLLGSGSLRAAAAECALKLTELSAGRIQTRFDSFLGLRHGPLASVDADTAVIGLLSSQPEERVYQLELVRELREKSLAGAIALVTPEPDPRAHELADIVVELGLPQAFPAAFRPLLDVTVGQVLALLGSLKHHVLPDAPSASGAIARVVTNIRPRSSGRGARENAR